MSDKNTRKLINFDLRIKDLERYYVPYSKKEYNNAYYEIRSYLTSEGFSWRQGSGYESDLPISTYKALRTLAKAKDKMPWLEKCVRDLTITEIGRTYAVNVKELKYSSPSLDGEKTNSKKKIKEKIIKRHL